MKMLNKFKTIGQTDSNGVYYVSVKMFLRKTGLDKIPLGKVIC